jgi:hypothetical protein
MVEQEFTRSKIKCLEKEQKIVNLDGKNLIRKHKNKFF